MGTGPSHKHGKPTANAPCSWHTSCLLAAPTACLLRLPPTCQQHPHHRQLAQGAGAGQQRDAGKQKRIVALLWHGAVIEALCLQVCGGRAGGRDSTAAAGCSR